MRTHTWILALLLGCTGTADDTAAADADCGGEGALASCLSPTQTAEYYAATSSMYFDTMDHTVELEEWPPYGETVARWEWPPWLKLTAYTRENIEATDTLLQLYPSVVTDRDCRGFDTQPFGRCFVTFYYDDPAHEGRGCPIYEEFIFNDAGEITWIEAWSDVDGLRPQAAGDTWAEAPDFDRLGTRVPGLGHGDGVLDLEAEAMTAALSDDPDLADFHARASDWYATWLAEYTAAGDDLWERGCGW